MGNSLNKYLARVNPRYFAGIHRSAADVDVRFYLRAVHIERHPESGVVMVATDGHTMAVIHDPNGWLQSDHTSILVERTSKRMLAAIARSRTSGLTPEHLWIADNCLVLSGNADASIEPDPFCSETICAERSTLVDGKYPDWRRVIPKGDPGPCPSLNPEYLARFHDIARALSGNKSYPGGGTTLVSLGPQSSVIVRFHDADLDTRFYGLIMPMRNEVLQSVPEFVKAWPEPQP